MTAWLEARTGLHLVDPWFLLLALLVPAALLARARRGAPALGFAPAALLRGAVLPGTLRSLFLPLPGVLRVLGLLLATVALSRPVARIPAPIRSEGIGILLCLDTSSSMAANDLDPRKSRLAVAKEAAERFVAGRPDDRIGLVAFARYPDLRCPPTSDHEALGKILAAVERVEADGPEDATGIGTAVLAAARVLRDSGPGAKVVILLTDGEENVATEDKPEEVAPLHAGQLCERLGIPVYVVVVGLGKTTAAGEWVELDTREVKKLAERTGGKFFLARDAGAVRAVYREIDALTRAAYVEPRYREEERLLPFLAAALLLLLLGRLLGAGPLSVLP